MDNIQILILFAAFLLIIIVILLFRSRNNQGVPLSMINQQYVPKDIYEKLEKELDEKEQIIEEKGNSILLLNRDLAYSRESLKNLNEKLEKERKELLKIQERFKNEFENLANRLLDEKSKRFTELNEKNLSKIISPFKEKLTDFKKEVENMYKEESKEVISLKIEIKNLMDLNRQVSRDADNLARALKGDPKVQGDWGEVKLEMVLEKAGLEKNIHYRTQEVFTDEENRKKRPDYIINLPENKHVIIDSKVSLTAYERYFNTEDIKEKENSLKEHLKSISDHISGLKGKNYQNLYQINSPDYILLYMPIESALILALKANPKILEEALEKNIVFVTTSTLLATLKTISYLWKQENQKKNVVEIARQGGALYDKFVNFVTDLKSVGDKLEGARSSYESAMNKLVSGGKKGDTIIGRIQNLKKLGASSTKVLPEDIGENN
ncbi:MAG: DNA recombination protein RmuC [Acidobacteriota bacterium]